MKYNTHKAFTFFNYKTQTTMKKIFTLAITATISIFSFKATAQGVALNTTGNKADTSAMLDVSSTTKGLLVPRMTAAQKSAIVSPATGLLVYQTDAPIGFYYYDGSAWVTLKGFTGATGSQGPQGNTGATGPVGATGAAGQGVPTGGTAGQVLSKVDGTNYNTQWTTPSSGGGNSFSFTSAIGTTNTNGNGTFYLVAGGANSTETNAQIIAPFACTKITLTSVGIGGNFSSSYTLSLRTGVNGSFTDIPNSSITISGISPQTVVVTGLNIPAGNSITVRAVGTATFTSQSRGIASSVLLQ